jgi:hypothetical protein
MASKVWGGRASPRAFNAVPRLRCSEIVWYRMSAGFGPTDREDPTPPTWEKQRLLAKGCAGQAAIPPLENTPTHHQSDPRLSS